MELSKTEIRSLLKALRNTPIPVSWVYRTRRFVLVKKLKTGLKEHKCG